MFLTKNLGLGKENGDLFLKKNGEDPASCVADKMKLLIIGIKSRQ